MVKELPGFYFDEEKNRYFPIKGPIPGSSRKRKSSASSSATNAQNTVSETNANVIHKRMDKLLHFRELCGNITPSSKGRLNFQAEYLKKLVSQPLVWKYHNTERIVESGLEQINILVNKPDGAEETDILLTGGANSTLCLFQVQKDPQEHNIGVKCVPKRAWLAKAGHHAESVELPRDLWRPFLAAVRMPSEISCIDEVTPGQVLVTTLGSGTSGGEVYMLDFSEAVDLEYNSNFPIGHNLIASFESTIWDAAANRDGSKVVVGTNRGASLVDIETGTHSQIFRCKSDVLSAEIDNSRYIILCGLRSGQIVTVDTREKPGELTSRCKIPACSFFPDVRLSGIMYGSCQTSMPSSICSLVSLIEYDQYFLASSMDGSIKLYDHRLLQKGALQSYEGNVNSHSRIQLGVDPTERIVMSGGEDCKLRLWSVRSGEMLFESQFMSSIPSVVCWPRHGVDSHEGYWHNHLWGAWFGSHEGLFYMNWP